MKRYSRILSASEGEDKFADAVSRLKDDFDFILSGLDTLERNGSSASLSIADEFSNSMNDIILQITNELQEVVE